MTTASLFDPLTRRRMLYRTNRLAKAFRLSPEDREDLKQDLVLELLRALQRHDPARSSAATFARGVMDRWYKHTSRRIRDERRLSPGFVPLSDSVCGSSACEDRHSDIAEADLRMDLEFMLWELPPQHGLLAEQLKSHSVAEIATARGVHRGTVHRHIRTLRERLSEAEALFS